jgi:protein-S-isoprenylcysteine O-methyltransferase Ste14
MKGFEIFPIASFLILLLLITGRIIFLKRKGITVNSVASERRKSMIPLYFLFFLFALLWLLQLAKPTFQFSFSVLPEAITTVLSNLFFLRIAGAFTIILALVLLMITLVHFKTSLRFGLNEKQSGKLITTGIFSITRNPFFLSLDLYFLGIAMLLPSLFFICFALLAAVGIHFFILKEEKFMLKVYGEEYEKYSKKVRRYF